MPRYRVDLKTGDLKNAGTDARVYMQLVGAGRDGRRCRLDNSADNFERGQLDRFDVDYEDVGWVNEIGLLNDNSGDKPGWYVDDITVTDKDTGISFHADFNRWLAESEGLEAKKKTNLGVVTLDKGIVFSEYVGASARHVDNPTPLTGTRELEFGTTVRSGFLLKNSTARVVTTGAKLSASFFGIGCEFNVGVTSTALDEFQTHEDMETQVRDTTTVQLLPNYSFTVILMWYQDTLRGHASANNVDMEFEQRWEPGQGYDPIFREGILTDEEVQEEVAAFLRRVAGENGEDLRSIPAAVPLAGAHIPVERRAVEGRITSKSVKVARDVLGARRGVRVSPITPPRTPVRDIARGVIVT